MSREDIWRRHGRAIYRGDLGRKLLSKLEGITHSQARTVIGRIRANGPTPPGAAKTHLVIGDAHAMPGEDMWRFSALGRMIADILPDVVVCIGDWADMPSLSAYDRGKRSFEGRRYAADIAAGNEALRLMHREIDDTLTGAWRPRFVYCEGNHEERIRRATNDRPELDGVIGPDDLDFARRGWECFDFLEPVEIDGVHYSHYHPSGVMGRPIGGLHPAASLIAKRLCSAVSGHTHTFDYSIRTDAKGRRFHGLLCGCYFDAEHGWARESNRMYWRGICVLEGVSGGSYDLHTYTMDRIRDIWG